VTDEPSTSKADPLVQQWQEDIGRISSEVVEMHHNRNVYRTVIKIAVEHGGLPASAFFNFLNATYGVTQVPAVRRQTDNRKDVVSLNRLLMGIKDKPERLTRDGFVERYDPDDVNAGFATWSSLFPGREYVDPGLVKADLGELRTAAEQAKQWVDDRVAHTARVAHTGRARVVKPPTHGELDNAIDTIGHVFQRYNLLLRGSSYLSLAPEGVPDDLDALFRQAWVR
jgi:hypothetical protein